MTKCVIERNANGVVEKDNIRTRGKEIKLIHTMCDRVKRSLVTEE